MTENKQALSPAEWKSVSDHLMELSAKVHQATGPKPQACEPSHESARATEPRNE